MDDIIDEFVVLLNRRELRGASKVALHTVHLLAKVLKLCPGDLNVFQLIERIRKLGKRLMKAVPQELAIGNIVRRVLFLIRSECDTAKVQSDLGAAELAESQKEHVSEGQASLKKLLDRDSEHESLVSVSMESLVVDMIRSPVLSGIEEIIFELEHVETHCSEFAIEHIHASEVILTFGRSSTVSAFFEEASKFRTFQVFVSESAPSYEGQTMAKDLAQKSVDTTVITDGDVFAMMARANKVIVGAHAVLANGGIITYSGAFNLAIAARYHRVPFVVVAGLYKLCPMYAFDQDTINEQNPPSEIVSFQEGCVEGLELENPTYDYIPPEFVSLFITNVGGHSPSYVYRLLSEFYRAEDHDL